MNGGSPKTITSYDKGTFRIEHVEEVYNFDVTDFIVENDKAIAHSLQEELTRLEIVEGSESRCAEDEDQQASIFTQDWLGFTNPGEQDKQGTILARDWLDSSRKHFDSDDKFNHEEGSGKGMVPKNHGELLAEDMELEVLPTIADEIILDADDAISDHQRLIARLELYDVVELKSHREQYENYVPMAYDDYLKKMSKMWEWGDHFTLQAAADTYGVKIFVITSFKDTCYIKILPQTHMTKRMIFSSFWAEGHYNSIYPQ
ncbi:Hypothetical predicted protein [Olea europaea subsp. europaea]|uniref:OTU domain-containing protein n=1 Tax=Olea europaea subsp. europaea TaxID=158383 RepID=A0A8S0RUQ3_OLEEU|nr:Hypothetical predicted protein [Olea europaea subsp. europaea]